MLFFDYVCCKCKKRFSFLGVLRCSCEQTHKYRAKPIVVNNIRFDSLSEGLRYSKLAFLEQKNIIQNLKVHPVFDLEVCDYEADFQYDYNSETPVEDLKGKVTNMFKLKMKMFKKYYPQIKLIIVKPY